MAEYKSVLDKFPPRGSKAYFDMMEKKQALETDTTLESLLAAPIRGAMAAKGAVNSIITPGTIGKNVARDEKQRDLIADIVKKTGQNPFKAPAEVLKQEKNARQLSRAGKDVLENTAGNLAGNVSFDAMAPEYKRGGKVSSASKRADGIAQRGKTRGKVC